MSRSAKASVLRKARQEKREYILRRDGAMGAGDDVKKAWIMFGGNLAQRIKEANNDALPIAPKRTLRAQLREKIMAVIRDDKKKTADMQRKALEEKFAVRLHNKMQRMQRRAERRTIQGA